MAARKAAAKTTKTTAAKKSASAAESSGTSVSASTPAAPAVEVPEVSVLVRRKELLNRVSTATGLRPNKIKPVMDAVLRELGEALAKGESLNIPPMGKLSVNRTKETENADIIVAKLRRSKNMVESDAADQSASDTPEASGDDD